jgi:hypothetical protein
MRLTPCQRSVLAIATVAYPGLANFTDPRERRACAQLEARGAMLVVRTTERWCGFPVWYAGLVQATTAEELV